MTYQNPWAKFKHRPSKGVLSSAALRFSEAPTDCVELPVGAPPTTEVGIP